MTRCSLLSLFSSIPLCNSVQLGYSESAAQAHSARDPAIAYLEPRLWKLTAVKLECVSVHFTLLWQALYCHVAPLEYAFGKFWARDRAGRIGLSLVYLALALALSLSLYAADMI